MASGSTGDSGLMWMAKRACGPRPVMPAWKNCTRRCWLTIPRSSSRTLWTSFTCPNMSGVEPKVLLYHHREQQEAFCGRSAAAYFAGDVVGVVTEACTADGDAAAGAPRRKSSAENDPTVCRLFGKQCRADAVITNNLRSGLSVASGVIRRGTCRRPHHQRPAWNRAACELDTTEAPKKRCSTR